VESTKVKNLTGAPLCGRLLALPVCGERGWKSLPGTNTLPYYENIRLWKKHVSVTKAVASYYVIFSTIIECFRARKKLLKFKFRRK
jgi:hypothetical protein